MAIKKLREFKRVEAIEEFHISATINKTYKIKNQPLRKKQLKI